MNGGAQAFLILAVVALFFAVVVVPMLGRILDGPTIGGGHGSRATLGASPFRSNPFGSAGFDPDLLGPGSGAKSAPTRSARSGHTAAYGSSGPGARNRAGAWDPDEDQPVGSDELDRMIDIDRVEGRLKSGSINKVMQLVDRHPQAAAAVLRNWIHRQD